MQKARIFGDLFLGAGAMKASTTWLSYLLAQHPEMHATPEKELHYFYHRHVSGDQLTDARRKNNVDSIYLAGFSPEKRETPDGQDRLAWVEKYLANPVDDAWFLSLFPPNSVPGYKCDFSNLHAHLPARAWRNIAAQADRLRVVYILRKPVDRLWSHVKFHLKFSGQLEALDHWQEADFVRFVRQKFIRRNGEYGKSLRAMKGGLAPEQLHVMFYEDIHADSHAALAQLEQFLGIAPFEYPEHLVQRKVNVSPSVAMPDFLPSLIARDSARIIKELQREGLQVPAAWTAG